MSGERSTTAHPANLSMVMVTVVVWAVAFPAIKVGLDGLPPLTLAALRFAIAWAFFLALHFTIGGGMAAIRALTPRQWGLIVAFGMFQTAASNIAQNIGMQWTSASAASIIQSFGPIFAVILALVLLGERYTHLKLVGGVVALVGTVGMIVQGGEGLGSSTFVGNVLMVVTALAYAIGGLIGKYVLREVDPLTLVTMALPAALVPLTVGAALESPGAAISGASLQVWGAVVFLAVGASGLAQLLWYIVLERVELSRLTYFIYLIPVVAVLVSWALLGETLTPLQVLFAALIIAGVAATQREEPATAGAVMGAACADENRES